MRRAFTIQMYDNGKLHAHICAECCKQWECRLDCFIEWIAEDHDHLGPDVLDRGEDTICVQCMDKPADWSGSSATIIEDLEAMMEQAVLGKR